MPETLFVCVFLYLNAGVSVEIVTFNFYKISVSATAVASWKVASKL